MEPIKLNFPIKRASGELITELTLPERLKMKHLKGVSLENIGLYEMGLIACRAAGLTQGEADELDMVDVAEVATAVAPLFEAHPQIGKK